MSSCFFQYDARYRRFLAGHPGLWAEVGVYEDPAFLSALRAERQSLGLADAVRKPRVRRPASRSVELRIAWGFAPPSKECRS